MDTLAKEGSPLSAQVDLRGASAGRGTAILTRLLHGAGAGAFAHGLGIVSNLVLLPLYLRTWSVAVYGEWMALYSLVNYLGTLDFGVTAAAVNAATMAYARGDWEEFRRTQGTAWAASLAIAGLGALLVVLPFLIYFRVERWLNLRSIAPAEARIIYACLAISILVSLAGRQFFAAYVAIGEFVKYQWLYNGFSIVSCLATATALLAGAGPRALSILTLVLALSTIAVARYLLHRRDPRLVPQLRAADWKTARTLAAPTGQFGLSILASVLSVQAPVVLLSRVLGGPAVALFTTTRTVANVIRQTTLLMKAPLRPELAALASTRSKAALGRLLRLAVSADAIAELSLFALLWSGGCWLIRFWSRGRIAPESGFLHLILIANVVEGFLFILGTAGWATNRARALSIAQFTTSIASLLLAIALVPSFGVSAVPLGAIGPLLLIMAPAAIRDASKNAGLTPWAALGRFLVPFIALTALSAAVSELIARQSSAPDWLSAPIGALAATAVVVPAVAAIFLTSDDRGSVYRRFLDRPSRVS